MKSIVTDTRAVSPIVATLLLIVVVASAASFIAVLVSNFGKETAEVDIENVGDAAAIRIELFGTDLAEPATDALGTRYEEVNHGVKVSVEGGDTAMGVQAMGMRLVDMATADRALELEELERYPALEPYQIGNAIIVVISNPPQNFTKAVLRGLYNGTNTTLRAYHCEGDSGIEDRFCEYLSVTIPASNVNTTASFELMLASIKDIDGSVGFIPFGYVMSGSDRAYLAGIENITPANITLEKVTEAVREDNETLYPDGLRPPLYYVTNGQPSTICDAFITWVCSPEGQLILREEGYVSLY